MFRRPRWQLPTGLAILVPALIFGWTLTAVFAAGEPSPSPSASAGGGGQGDPESGKKLFGSSGCAGCHGASLTGGIGPRLNPIVKLPGVANPRDPGFIKTTVKNGRPADPGFSSPMPAFPDLSDQQLNDLAAYILSQQGQTHGLEPVELARSNVFWVTVGIASMVFLTWLLARYNMRWVDRRAVARRERERLS